MNREKILRWVTFIVNLIVYFAAANMVLLFFLRVFVSPGSRHAVWFWGFSILLDALILYFLTRYLFREIVLRNGNRQAERGEKPSRTVTIMRYPGLTILCGVLLLLGGKIIGCFDFFYAGWPLLIFPVAVVVAVVLGILRPKKWETDLVCLRVWGLLLGIPCAFVLLALLAMSPTRFEYRTTEVRPWRYFALSARDIRRCFPPEAKNCRIRGTRGFNTAFCWSCECSEPEFLQFARRNGYDIRENNTSFNTDRRVDDIDYFGFLRGSGIDRKPESFYFHNERRPNCSGWTLLYDRKTHTLYGNHTNR